MLLSMRCCIGSFSCFPGSASNSIAVTNVTSSRFQPFLLPEAMLHAAASQAADDAGHLEVQPANAVVRPHVHVLPSVTSAAAAAASFTSRPSRQIPQ